MRARRNTLWQTGVVLGIGVAAVLIGVWFDEPIIYGGCYTFGFLCLPTSVLMYKFGG